MGFDWEQGEREGSLVDGLVEYGEWCKEMGPCWIGRVTGWVQVGIFGNCAGTIVQRYELIALQYRKGDTH